MTTGLPWVHAKWAMTLDGKIASKTGSSRWITNDASREIVHQLRGRMDAILVGVGTVLADDPALTARPPGPRTPTRIVLDSSARAPLESQLVRTARETPTIVVTTVHADADRCSALRTAGVQVLMIESDSSGHPDLEILLTELGRQRLTNVFVEGGGQVLGAFFARNLIDEVHAFIAPKLIGGADAASPLMGEGRTDMREALSLEDATVKSLDGDVYLHGWTARA